MFTRKETRQVHAGKTAIGHGAPVTIQSMCNTPTSDAAATLAQIRALRDAGCQIIRVAVPDEAAVHALPEIIAGAGIPVVADIHFDYRLALGAIQAGIHAVRINPGNIGAKENVRKVAEAAGNAGIPIRVGANSGSLPKELREKAARSPEDMADALAMAALKQAQLLEEYDFRDVVVSLKSSSVCSTVLACRSFAGMSDYPQHIGVTESGTPGRGIIKSSVGIGTLLMEGIGDTMRVSLTADPVREVRTAIAILEACGLRRAEPELVSCPTCGRTKVNLEAIASEIEQYVDSLKGVGKRINLRKIAVMGCVVNGPGEAADADIGLAGGDHCAAVFEHGKILKTLPENEAVALLKSMIDKAVLTQAE